MRKPEKTFLTSSVDSELVRSIAASIGPDTVVVTILPEARYRELSAGSIFSRLWLRFLTHAVFPFWLVIRATFSPPGSVWIVSTNPFHAPTWILNTAKAHGRKMVHLIFDLYPDALEVAGLIPRDGRRSRKIGAAIRKVQERCDGAVYLGELLRRHAEARHGSARVSAVIDAAADDTQFHPNQAAEGFPLELHYGGQLGAMHDTESLLAAVVGSKRDRADGLIAFDFRVGGPGIKRLAAARGGEGVVIEPPIGVAEWRDHVSRFPIGIVTLSPAGALVCLPSKTYGLMAAGCAIIAICPGWSDLGKLIRETGAGWVIDNSVVEEAPEWGENGIDEVSFARRPAMEVGAEIVSILRRLPVTPKRVDEFRANALAAAKTTFGRSSMSAAWHDFLSKIRYPRAK